MSSLERYDSAIFAYQYEYIKGRKSNNGDIEYYIEKLKNKKNQVLEIGSGTGRITIELAKNNIEVFGIDNASAMIDIAKKKLKDLNIHNVKLQTLDVLKLKKNIKYDSIIIPFNTLCFFENLDYEAIFKLLKSILNPEGLLYFDFTRPKTGNYKEITKDRSRWSEKLYIEELELYLKWRMMVFPDMKNQSVKYEYIWKVSDDPRKDFDLWEEKKSSMNFSSLPFSYYDNLLSSIGLKCIEKIVKNYTRDGGPEEHYFCTYSN